MIRLTYKMSDKAAIIKEAQKYLIRGQVDKAIAEWEKLIKETPDGNTYNIVGDLYLKKGDKRPAIDFFHKAARFFRNEGFSLKALALYKKILNINPSDTNSLYALGELSEEKGLITDAIKYYLTTADILSKEGRKERLLQIYDRILSLSPSNIPLRNKVAEFFAKEGFRTEAAKEYLYIARLYDDKDDFGRAKEYFKRVLDIQRDNKDALLGLSLIYERAGDVQQTIEYMEEAITFSPHDTELLLRYAQLLMIRESLADAKGYVSKVIEAEPSNIAARKLLGEIYLKEGDKRKAWEDYSAVLDEMVLNEKFDDAVNILKTFKDIDPIQTGKRLVSLYKQTGDNEAAFDELVYLGDVLVDSEMPKEALSCYREALQIHPDSTAVQDKITAVERKIGEERIKVRYEKSVEEAMTEADIFLRYGLYDEARALLEELKDREAENIDVHMKLKSLYVATGDKNQAVTECLILAEIYGRGGEIERKEAILKEAYEISPEDPRLLDRIAAQPSGDVALVSEKLASEPDIEDYSEDIAEAEFYLRQGLTYDAMEIYKKLLEIFPDDDEIRQKLLSVEAGEEAALEEKVAETVVTEKPAEKHVVQEGGPIEAHEIPEPTLDSNAIEIFEEFKKCIGKDLEAEDSETHYNLGLAYKEMGLIDDAIKEFQTSRNDPKRFIQSTNMLGICYMGKGLFPFAIDSFNSALEKIDVRDESYWGVKYDLAEAYEKNGDLKEASELYTEVYGWNSKFRNVADKINLLRVMLAKTAETPGKQKVRKDRVSYL